MIFEHIHLRSDIKTIVVEHNTTLPGIKGKHQIDLYWKFELSGIVYYTIIQVKNWRSRVNQGELLKFSAVLNDLPNQPRGVFVTRSGYQKGAKQIADAEGILLYELQPISKSDPNKDINVGFLNFNFSMVEHNNVRVIPDAAWLKEKGITHRNQIVPRNAMVFYDEKNNELGTLTSVLKSYNDKPRPEIKTEVFHRFEQPTFCKSNDGKVPLHKVTGFTFTPDPKKWSETKPLLGSDIVGFVLNNITKESHQEFEWKPGLKIVERATTTS